MRFYIFLGISSFYLLASCDAQENSNSPMLSSEEIPVENILHTNSFDLIIDQQLLDDIQTHVNKECEQSNITTYDWSNDDAKETILDMGVIFKHIHRDTAFSAFKKFNEQVKSEGNYLFLTNIDFEDDWQEFYDVAILPCEDQFSLIEMIGTDGVNTDHRNEEIVAKMRKWHEEFGINISYCDYSGIDAFMLSMPEDIEKFANEVYAFSPYVIDEDAESIEAYIKEIQEERFFYVWWGVSFLKKKPSFDTQIL